MQINSTDNFELILESFSEKKIEYLIRRCVNDILFDVRTFAIKDRKGMASEFTIRDKGLIRRHIRIKKAIGVIGYFGSVKSPRFSGWTEQQHGKSTRRKIKVHTSNARGSGGKRKLRNKFRRGKGAVNVLRSKVANATGSYAQMIAANLAMLRRNRENIAVEIPIKIGKTKPGIYNMMKSGKLKQMEIYEEKQPKRNLWANDIVNRYLSTGRAVGIFNKNMNKLIEGAKK